MQAITRRGWGGGLAGVGLLAAAGAATQEAPWPNRPVTLLIPWGAGGSTDAFGRILAQHLQQILGQPSAPTAPSAWRSRHGRGRMATR